MALILVVCAGAIEIGSRLAHRGVAPMLPYQYAEGVAQLIPGSDLRAAFSGRPANRYVVDPGGARLAAAVDRSSPLRAGVLVVGDSQALGYMLDYEQTFAALVATAVASQAEMSRILAAPASQPDMFLQALKRYRPFLEGRQRLAIVTLNLGNDLDEMYLAGISSVSTDFDWLWAHSFAYMDWVLLFSSNVRGEDDLIGVNNVIRKLSSGERVVLARAAADRLLETLNALDADEKIVVIVPADYQYDPAQMRKYGQYYTNKTVFGWVLHEAGEYAATMNVLEDYIARRLADSGVKTVRFSGGALAGRDAIDLFDGASHHLTPSAHRAIAREILHVIGPDDQRKVD